MQLCWMHRDAAMLDASQPPVEQEPVEGDPSPCPEDEEFFVRPGWYGRGDRQVFGWPGGPGAPGL